MAVTPSDAARSLARVRWAQALVSAAIGIALVGTAIESWRSAERIAGSVTAAQGHRLLRIVGRALFAERAADRETLERVRAAHADLGLRCIALARPPAAEPLVAGDCRLRPDALARMLAALRPRAPIAVDDAVAMVAGRPRGSRGRLEGPGRLGSRRLLIVFRPVEAEALRRSVRRSLGVALAAVAALLAGGAVLWRLSRRAERLQDAAERDRRLVTLGEMSAVLAHEIRNPLAALKGHAQLLRERLGDAGPLRDKADRVVGEAQRLERLTEDLLSLVRSNRVQTEAVDPVLVLRAAARAVDGARVDVETAGAPARWALDAARMQQVLVNLLRNALEAAPEGRVTAAVTTTPGGALVYRVRDRGPGLPPGDASRVFEPFFTTRTQGTGLGLAVVRRIVELHGGTVTARTHRDGGAEFEVVLP